MRKAIAVADSGPLIGLARIGQLELLPRIFSEIISPPEVWHEVTEKGRGIEFSRLRPQCQDSFSFNLGVIFKCRDVSQIIFGARNGKGAFAAMTYNFDPDKWYDNELFLIQSRLKAGEITRKEYDEAVELLDKKLEEMWHRLDMTYQIP